MPFYYQPYTFLLFGAVGVSTALVFAFFRHRSTSSSHSFAVIMGAVGMLATMTLFEVITQELNVQALAENLKHVWVAIPATALLLLTLQLFKYLRSGHTLDVVPIARDIVIQNMSEGLFVLDAEHRILDINATASTLMRMPSKDIIGKHAQEVISWWPKSSTRKARELIGLPPVVEVNNDHGIRRLQVNESILPYKNSSIGHLVLLRDITEECRLQEQLLQSQKMEAIGTLAGGVAHDFNNLLMGMQANLSMLQIDNDPTRTNQKKLKRIEDQIQSGAALTRQLLGYARKGKYVITTIDMHHLIKETLHVIRRTNKNVLTTEALYAPSALVEADRGQMELVLLNLFVNAVDAMPRGGELKVASRIITHSVMADIWPGLKPGRYLEIRVSDSGTGMDQATIGRIFEPFFTTKATGRGTGLGLASVYSVVKKHAGRVRVTSRVGQGSTFTLLFPASGKSMPTACEMHEAAALSAPSNGRQILIVEDDAAILALIGGMVQSLGYTSLLAGEGREALRIFKDQHATIELVILDMIMPHMDGYDVFEALRAIDPQVKIIVASGFGPSARLEEILSQGPHLLLKKPFNRSALSQAMDRLLTDESEACPTTNPPAAAAGADTLAAGRHG
jgi:two-component system, cell cycle sensor histidine kinase and response regulator CckA